MVHVDHHNAYNESSYDPCSDQIQQVDIQDAVPVQPGISLHPLKITTDADKHDLVSPPQDPARHPSMASSHEPASESASIHSLPAVLVTETEQPHPPSSTRTTEQSRQSAQPLPPSSNRSQALRETPAFAQNRRARHHSVELRPSNRLSGFFNNLIHRRDHAPNGSDPNSIREESSPPATSNPAPGNPSRSPSPTPPRPITPPPVLPPPTLQELGLSLSEVTSDLSPSHFSNPPLSGAFLAPHYLLLCHSQGLDVFPITSPPAPQPYAVIRRVSFKSVVVMEQRGVMVAIAGRRDGVRVYALEEVKKAIESRIDVEVRKERERQRRENNKKPVSGSVDQSSLRNSGDKMRRMTLSTPPPGESNGRNGIPRKLSTPLPSASSQRPTPALVPRPPVPRSPARRPRTPQTQRTADIQEPLGQPPPYACVEYVEMSQPQQLLQNQTSNIFPDAHLRVNLVSNMLGSNICHSSNVEEQDGLRKPDWAESSDDEAINVVAAGTSGSQALDERTSANHIATVNIVSESNVSPAIPQPATAHTTVPVARRSRPADLDLTLSHSPSMVSPSESSPAPTLLSLRQALAQSPFSNRHIQPNDINNSSNGGGSTVPVTEDADEDEEEIEGQISLTQALLESRLPELPPIGTRRPQQPILITSSHPIVSGDDEPSSPRTSEGHSLSVSQRSVSARSQGRRRRWSVLISNSSSFTGPRDAAIPIPEPPSTAPPARERNLLNRSGSFRSTNSQHTNLRPSSSDTPLPSPSAPAVASLSGGNSIVAPLQSTRSRFLPRILSNAFQSRRSEDRIHTQSHVEPDNFKRPSGAQLTPNYTLHKLDYVKLPGTKGALMVKAVETQKKSFLAILCGENGEKVELFAGTHRTALGLSRTFILPDSPKSLELQLQGDDLVEVFLVFSQNVFGLEPATVRVREVRIGRAERRAARRRAREMRVGEAPVGNEAETVEEETNVSVNVAAAVGSATASQDTGNRDSSARSSSPMLIPREHPDAHPERPSSTEPTVSVSQNHADEVATAATAHMGPYTTFQQLSFAPKFPLASIADEYVIPPTYPDFIEYRNVHEHETSPADNTAAEPAHTQFSPPGLPVPPPVTPSKWYYCDPKGVIHGPWKASLMQAWYKDGLLPLDLPVRREEDTEYTLLRELRLQSVDPTHPFRPRPPTPSTRLESRVRQPEKPLLPPISLLAQQKHFGPPALFYSSRGGHSTAIVDARGRPVLKERFVWSNDEHAEDAKSPFGRMGDVKRLEAFDVKDRSILVAMRHGGLEAVDLGDALLKPADESRTTLPQFNPSVNSVSRRAPFVWKIGTPISSSPSSSLVLSTGIKRNKKQSQGSAKSPAGKTEFSVGDTDSDNQEEVLFLGRKDDEIYLCERNAGSFRILRLCPQTL
ncbi:hypothetical protein AX17_000595 [Amanita inopinata Kibby_2008]|nr:hypothetical protein AX17_000595 [Amanita inopinata Kibby_2008]